MAYDAYHSCMFVLGMRAFPLLSYYPTGIHQPLNVYDLFVCKYWLMLCTATLWCHVPDNLCLSCFRGLCKVHPVQRWKCISFGFAGTSLSHSVLNLNILSLVCIHSQNNVKWKWSVLCGHYGTVACSYIMRGSFIRLGSSAHDVYKSVFNDLWRWTRQKHALYVLQSSKVLSVQILMLIAWWLPGYGML